MQNRVLAFALLFSLLIHLVLVCCFRIRLFDFAREPAPFSPVALVVENEPSTSTLFLESPHKKSAPVCIDELTPHTVESRREIQGLFASIYDFPTQSYPLKIKCSPTLKPLLLIEDGSHFFKNSTSFSQAQVALLKSQKFTIEYRIRVDGTTGAISSWKRRYELLDKELQCIADKIVAALRFVPYKQSLSGKLWLKFYCTGEELPSYLKEKSL